MSEKRQTGGPEPATMNGVIDDFERCYRFMRSRDARYDGFFFVGVTSTGIYCRPSCPARLPHRRNVRLFASAAAAQAAGLRACKRCEPDAAPGSPAWNRRADVAGRAFRLIADGIVDREGVTGLASRLGFSERQLNRILVAEVGAGPAQLARAQRAQAARTLIESTGLSFAEVALAAGFGSIRQFNDTVRAIYARTPSELRRRARRTRGATTPGAVELRLPARAPLDGRWLLEFLGARAIPGVEHVEAGTYRRSLALEHGAGLVALTPEADAVRCVLRLDDLRDLTAAVARCRRLLDLDADPLSIAGQLGADPVLGEVARRRPGLRVPGTVDGFELAVRAIVGQQVSVPRGAHRAGPTGRALRRAAARAGRPDHASLPDGRNAVGARSRRPAVPAPAGRGPALARAAGRRPRGSASTPAPTRPPRSRLCSTSPAWDRGPRRMWRCARSATRTPSRPATSASSTGSSGSASPPRVPRLRRSPSPGGPGAPTP